MTDATDGGHRSAPGSVDQRAAWLRRAIYTVIAAGIVAFILRGSDGPEDPVLAPARGTVPSVTTPGAAPTGCTGSEGDARRPLEGFGEVVFGVARPDGSTFEGCALLADTPDARGQGLMAQQDMRGYDAMVFRFDGASTGAFYMFRTVLPLSIAYIGVDGGLVSMIDMDPCPEEEASACPRFPAAGPYLHAIEVAQGDLASIGIVSGATVTFGARPVPS